MAHLSNPGWTPPEHPLDRVTGPDIHPPPANPLADELRSIARTCNDGTTHARLHELADRIERLASEPDVHELDAVAAGLDPEQESRADALTAAARLLAPALTDLYPVTVAENLTTIARLWIELAYHGDAWIADGHRPVDDDERDERRRP